MPHTDSAKRINRDNARDWLKHKRLLRRTKVEHKKKVAAAMKCNLAYLETCEANVAFDVNAFCEIYNPDRKKFKKNRIDQMKHFMGPVSYTELVDHIIEQSLSDPIQQMGFFSSKLRREFSLRLTVVKRAWNETYFPSTELKALYQRVSQWMGCRPSLAFRLTNGIFATWCLKVETLESHMWPMVDLIQQLQNSVNTGEGISITPYKNYDAPIPCRSVMIEPVNLYPIFFDNKPKTRDPNKLLKLSPPPAVKKTPKTVYTCAIPVNDTGRKLRRIRKAFLGHYPRSRHAGIVSLLNYIFDQYLKTTDRKNKPGRYGPGSFPLVSRFMKTLNDEYSPLVKALTEYKVLRPAKGGGYSPGGAYCFDPVSRYYFLRKNAVVPRVPSVRLVLRKIRKDGNTPAQIAEKIKINEKTIRNYYKDPKSVRPSILSKLIAAFNIDINTVSAKPRVTSIIDLYFVSSGDSSLFIECLKPDRVISRPDDVMSGHTNYVLIFKPTKRKKNIKELMDLLEYLEGNCGIIGKTINVTVITEIKYNPAPEDFLFLNEVRSYQNQKERLSFFMDYYSNHLDKQTLNMLKLESHLLNQDGVSLTDMIIATMRNGHYGKVIPMTPDISVLQLLICFVNGEEQAKIIRLFLQLSDIYTSNSVLGIFVEFLQRTLKKIADTSAFEKSIWYNLITALARRATPSDLAEAIRMAGNHSLSLEVRFFMMLRIFKSYQRKTYRAVREGKIEKIQFHLE